MKQMQGQVVLLLGASRGIGAEAARSLARRGATVMLASRSEAACAALAAELRTPAAAVACDVADYAAVRAAVDATVRRFGRVDVLVNNAGVIEPISRLEDSDPAGVQRAVQINFLGVYHGIRAVLPHFVANGRGTIVNVSSGAGEIPIEGWSHYCSAKAAVIMLTRCTDAELRAKGIKCFGLQPGIADTGMQVAIRASGINELSRRPRHLLPPASEAGEFIAWVCAEAPEDLAGREFRIDDPALRKRAGLPAR